MYKQGTSHVPSCALDGTHLAGGGADALLDGVGGAGQRPARGVAGLARRLLCPVARRVGADGHLHQAQLGQRGV